MFSVADEQVRNSTVSVISWRGWYGEHLDQCPLISYSCKCLQELTNYFSSFAGQCVDLLVMYSSLASDGKGFDPNSPARGSWRRVCDN